MRTLLIIFLLAISTLIIAARPIHLPNGENCMIGDNGVVFGCSGSSNSSASTNDSSTCIGTENKLANVNRRLRQGYGSREGEILKAKRREYNDILDRYCR